MNEYYTYAYLREDGTPYYIGKGKGRRMCQQNNHAVRVPNKNSILILKDNLTEEEAFLHEVYMISVLGRKDLGTGILRNLTEGGEGFSSATMRRFWERRRERKIQEWRDEYDKQQVGREQREELFNKLIQKVVSNRTFCSG